MTPRHKLVVALGALGLIILLWRVDLNAVQLSLLHVGWGMALVLSQEIVAHVLNAWGWHFAFTREVAERSTCLRAQVGAEYPTKGVFLEVVEPERIVSLVTKA